MKILQMVSVDNYVFKINHKFEIRLMCSKLVIMTSLIANLLLLNLSKLNLIQGLVQLLTSQVINYPQPSSSPLCSFPANTPRVFHVKTMWKRTFPRRFNVKYTWSVCRVIPMKLHIQKRLISEFYEALRRSFCKNSYQLKRIHYFCKKPHLRC